MPQIVQILIGNSKRMWSVEANIQLNIHLTERQLVLCVERNVVDSPYSRLFVNYSHGFKGVLNSDFKYESQLHYKQTTHYYRVHCRSNKYYIL